MTIQHQRRDQIAKQLYDRLVPFCGQRPDWSLRWDERIWLEMPVLPKVERALPAGGDTAVTVGQRLQVSWWRSRGFAAGVTISFDGVRHGRWVVHAIQLDLYVMADGIRAEVAIDPTAVRAGTFTRLALMDDALGGLIVRALGKATDTALDAGFVARWIGNEARALARVA